MSLINCCPHRITVLSPERKIVRQFAPAVKPARAWRHNPVMLPPVDGMAVAEIGAYRMVDGLPKYGDVIVTADVVAALRFLGLRHNGRVYSPQTLDGWQTIVCGLIYHADVSDAPDPLDES